MTIRELKYWLRSEKFIICDSSKFVLLHQHHMINQKTSIKLYTLQSIAQIIEQS